MWGTPPKTSADTITFVSRTTHSFSMAAARRSDCGGRALRREEVCLPNEVEYVETGAFARPAAQGVSGRQVLTLICHHVNSFPQPSPKYFSFFVTSNLD